jgi:hypothetical protein
MRDILTTLREARAGLLFPSETDAPLEPFFWPAPNPAPLTAQALPPFAGVAADAPIKVVKLAAFFRPATYEEEWMNAEERVEVQRFQELVKTLQSILEDVNVFKIGTTDITVFIVGQVEGGYAGLKTHVVET